MELARFLPESVLTIPSEIIDATGCGMFPSAIKNHVGEAKVAELTRTYIRQLIETDRIDLDLPAKVTSSKTTTRYLQSLKNMVATIEPYLGDVQFDVPNKTGDQLHMANEDTIFQIEVTNKINWLTCVVHLFGLTFNMPQRYVCLMFPLQEAIWSFDLSEWTTRAKFNVALLDGELDEDVETDICCRYGIGSHRSQHIEMSLPQFIAQLSGDLPWQIFLGDKTSAATRFEPGELELARQVVADSHLQLYVHSPMIINLCRAFNDPTMLRGSAAEGWHVNLLRRNLVYARKIGCRGVVVHTGNSVKMPLDVAVDNMKQNILRLLPEATEACPLLLETSAAEGTDTCWKLEDFTAFIDSIPDPRFGITFDTAHVWGAGYQPLDFLTPIISRVKLIHYNDSKVIRGSRRDLHQNIGLGFIPLDQLTGVADLAKLHGIPMVRE